MINLRPPGHLVEKLLYILSNYNFVIEHKGSEELINVDYLTREGCNGSPTPEDLEFEIDTKDITISSIVIQRGGPDKINWKREQDKDEDLKFVKQWLKDGNQPSKEDLKCDQQQFKD